MKLYQILANGQVYLRKRPGKTQNGYYLLQRKCSRCLNGQIARNKICSEPIRIWEPVIQLDVPHPRGYKVHFSFLHWTNSFAFIKRKTWWTQLNVFVCLNGISVQHNLFYAFQIFPIIFYWASCYKLPSRSEVGMRKRGL